MKIVKNFVQKLRQKCSERIEKFREIPWLIRHEDIFDDPIEYLTRLSFYYPSHPRSKDRMPKIISWLIFLNISVYISMSVGDMLSDSSVMQRVLFGVTVGLCWIFVGGKFLHYFFAKKKIEELQNSLKEFYPKTFDDKAGKYFWHLKLLRVSLNSVLIVCVIIFALTPLVVYFVYGEIITPIPIAIYLLPTHLNLIYPLVYLWSLLVVVQSIKTNFFFDIMTFTIFSAISLEWETLDQSFRDLNNIDNPQVIKDELKKLLNRHLRLTEISGKLQNIFSDYYLIYFLLNTITIAISTFQVATVPAGSQMSINSYVIVSALLSQVFWNCFFGQLLMTKSENLADGIYDCGWEKFQDLRMKKSILIVLMNAQRGASVTTKFKAVSMAMFYDIIDKSYSYYSVLTDVHGKRKN